MVLFILIFTLLLTWHPERAKAHERDEDDGDEERDEDGDGGALKLELDLYDWEGRRAVALVHVIAEHDPQRLERELRRVWLRPELAQVKHRVRRR